MVRIDDQIVAGAFLFFPLLNCCYFFVLISSAHIFLMFSAPCAMFLMHKTAHVLYVLMLFGVYIYVYLIIYKMYYILANV